MSNKCFAARPVISIAPQDAQTSIGGKVTFKCEASGSPPPTLYWTHEGKGIIIESGQSWFHLAHVE